MAKSKKVIATAKKNKCLITVVFEREMTSKEIDRLRESYKQNKIKSDPDKDLEAALAEQLSYELRDAHEEQLAGFHQIKRVRTKRGFARKKMDWKEDTGQRGGKED